MKPAILLVLALVLLPAVSAADLIITEVYYDHPGLDSDAEWVEIFNTGPDPVDLAGYQLCNGGTSYTWSVNVLSGTVDACATFVVGGPYTDADNYSPIYDLVLNFNPDFQNAGTTCDAVALFAPGADPATACPLSAVIYGSENNNGLVDGTCAAGLPSVGDAPDGQSIERTDYPADTWVINATPTPNGVGFSCGGTPAESSTWSAIKSQFR